MQIENIHAWVSYFVSLYFCQIKQQQKYFDHRKKCNYSICVIYRLADYCLDNILVFINMEIFAGLNFCGFQEHRKIPMNIYFRIYTSFIY